MARDNLFWQFNDNTWEEIIRNISRGDYVLVLGNEGILDPAFGGGDSKTYINTLVGRHMQEMIASGSSMSGLNQKNLLLDILADNPCTVEQVSQDLRKLLGTRCFRTVLTTSYDGFVEAVMREVWGDSLRVLDIYGDRSSDFDFPNEIVSDEFYDIQPTLYYIFGKADPSHPRKDFVADDNDSIVAISRWMNVGESPRKFINYLKKKSLLSIGCKFEDWFFRFFWYILRRDIRNLKNGQVAITLNDKSDSDINLGKYLKAQLVNTYPDACKFMQELSRRMQSLGTEIGAHLQKDEVFISYAGEDSAMAAILFRKLQENNIDVWMDSGRLFCGDDYDRKIQEAIYSCKVFLTILSPQVRDDLQKGVTDRYYLKEWRMAAERIGEGMRLFPVAIDGYDIRGEYHRRFESMMAPVTAYDMQSQPLSSLIDRIQMILGR